MEKLNFKPINSGLGFQKFSDGLPYEPAKPAKAAKPPQPTPTQKPRSIAPPKPPISTPVRQTIIPPAAPQVSVVEKDVASLPVMAYGLAYSLKRSVAYFFDFLLAAGLATLAIWGALQYVHVSPKFLLEADTLPFAVIFMGAFIWCVITAQEIAFNTSMGKRIFGLYLFGTPFQIFARAIFFIFSWVLGGLGILSGAFGKRKRCWHDVLSSIQPESFSERRP